MDIGPLYLSTILYGVGIVALIGLTALYLNVLTKDGFLAGLLIGVPILVFGGFDNFILLLVFLVIGSMLSRVGKDIKNMYNPVGERVGTRAWPNVVANGFWPMISSVLIYFSSNPFVKVAWELFFIGSLASMVADTSATEIGMLSRERPRMITYPNNVVMPGTSGGVTILGTVASICVTLIFGLLAYLISGFNPFREFTLIGFSPLVYLRGSEAWILFIIVLSGVLGNVFDSLLGASVQAKYRCVSCGKYVESSVHCSVEAEYIKGIKFIDNHMVNFISSLAGGLIAVGLFFLI